MSGDHAWDIQSSLPEGHSFVGVIGASDKTPLTLGSGNKEMHPLLLSLANIHADVRMKASSHAFALAAYLPIPKFLNVSPAIQSVLSARVYHFAISIVMQNLKEVAREGAVMSDPNGLLRLIHTPLVSWIANLPEQHVISCSSLKYSPISTASTEHFGEATPYPLRDRQATLDAIREACRLCDPCDIAAFHKVCLSSFHLNGVVLPFWADWGNACPSMFLTPDALHQWHKFYYDHCVRWVINMIGGTELDRRFSVLQPRTGTRHWPNGVSTLKQTSGKDHRDFEKLLPVVATGAVPNDVLCALRAITEFIFLAQSVHFFDETLYALSEALREFHHYKSAIIAAGGRQGKNGPLNHFRIPKLELTLHVERSVRMMGAAYQWTSDITERCHITHVKIPYRLSNHRDFHEQCCRFLDRQEKQRFFQHYTTLKTAHAPLINEIVHEMELVHLYRAEPTSDQANTLVGSVDNSAGTDARSNEQLIGLPSQKKSIFDKRHARISADNKSAILLTVHPHFPDLDIDVASQTLGITDLRPAFGDFFSGRSYGDRNGCRYAAANCPLPFTTLHAWNKLRIQHHSVQNPLSLVPPQTIQAVPPSSALPFGRANTVLLAHESGEFISTNMDDERYVVAQVRAILQPQTKPPSDPLLYVQFFSFSPSHIQGLNGIRVVTPAPHVEMFLVRRRIRNDGQFLGDIVYLNDVRQVVQLVPKFGSRVPENMTCDNSLEIGGEFYVNSFADKETFHAILSYQ
ncbi:hypothetical protein J3R83DRAFT_7607 [Lanmaoa asiatica]|nr:hypothetical protein J3R83DRAFT_7607 [Lanmaoa asiatica]